MLHASKTIRMTLCAVAAALAAATVSGLIINGTALPAGCLTDIHACRGSMLSDIIDSAVFLGVLTAFVCWRYRVEMKPS